MFRHAKPDEPAIARRLFIFDMDGTLLPKTTANLELARATGTSQQLTALESAFASGAVTTKGFATQIHELWGRLDPLIVRRAFDEARKLQRIAEVMAAIAAGGGKACVITMSPDYFADHLHSLGVHYVYASAFPRGAGEPLDVQRILTPEDKPVIARRLCAELGFVYEESVAFGDSMSDYPLFRSLSHTVAINGGEDIRRLAQHCYDGDDLWEAFVLAVQAARSVRVAPAVPARIG